MCAEERLHEDTLRRWQSSSQGDRPQEKLNLLTPSSRNSSLQICEKINFLLYKPLSLWYFVMAATKNSYGGAFFFFLTYIWKQFHWNSNQNKYFTEENNVIYLFYSFFKNEFMNAVPLALMVLRFFCLHI